MWITRVGNLYAKSHNTWYPLYEIQLQRTDGARWLDEVEFEFWGVRESREMIISGTRYLVECLQLRNSRQRMALIMPLPDGFDIGVNEASDEQLP